MTRILLVKMRFSWNAFCIVYGFGEGLKVKFTTFMAVIRFVFARCQLNLKNNRRATIKFSHTIFLCHFIADLAFMKNDK